MTQQQRKNQRLIILIFAMSFLPFMLAWYLKENPNALPASVGESTNYGQLVIPPVTTDLVELVGMDQFSKNNIAELAGRWVLVNIIPGHECQKICGDALHKTKQLVLMLNKDLTRTRRLVIVMSDIAPEAASVWWTDDTYLLRALPTPELRQKLLAITKNNVADGMLMLMDPLGNIMMQYPPEFDVYRVKDDLKKLLMASQIG